MNEAAESERVLGLSISESSDLLSYGFGSEHLRELLVRICQPLIAILGKDYDLPIQLAYAGHIEEGSFALDLINLIRAEQSEGSTGAQSDWTGKLYNPSPWPHYQQITPAYEANWINACKFVRITQEMAGLEGDEVIEFPPADVLTPRIAYNRSRVLTKTRQIMSTGLRSDDGKSLMPPLNWRVVLGGKVTGFTGIMPGIFEEFLCSLDPPEGAQPLPVYILGGFGGAARDLADALLTGNLPESFGADFHKNDPGFRLMQEGYANFGNKDLPERELERLSSLVKKAHNNLAETFRNGLTDEQNEELLRTSDFSDVARLIFNGILFSTPC